MGVKWCKMKKRNKFRLPRKTKKHNQNRLVKLLEDFMNDDVTELRIIKISFTKSE